MEPILYKSDVAGSGKARIRLQTRPDMMPLSVELTLDQGVYLHEAELVQDCGAHARTLPLAYKDESSAVWRQVEACPAHAEPIGFSVSWLAIDNAAPGGNYTAILTIRDAHGYPLEACGGSQNPAHASGQIGPVGNPTDIGRLSVTAFRQHSTEGLP